MHFLTVVKKIKPVRNGPDEVSVRKAVVDTDVGSVLRMMQSPNIECYAVIFDENFEPTLSKIVAANSPEPAQITDADGNVYS